MLWTLSGSGRDNAKFDFYVFVFDRQENVGNVPTIFFFYFKIEKLKMNVFSN